MGVVSSCGVIGGYPRSSSRSCKYFGVFVGYPRSHFRKWSVPRKCLKDTTRPRLEVVNPSWVFEGYPRPRISQGRATSERSHRVGITEAREEHPPILLPKELRVRGFPSRAGPVVGDTEESRAPGKLDAQL